MLHDNYVAWKLYSINFAQCTCLKVNYLVKLQKITIKGAHSGTIACNVRTIACVFACMYVSICICKKIF
jgi:hypothetical protein